MCIYLHIHCDLLSYANKAQVRYKTEAILKSFQMGITNKDTYHSISFRIEQDLTFKYLLNTFAEMQLKVHITNKASKEKGSFRKFLPKEM